jgi:hypothetical protein
LVKKERYIMREELDKALCERYPKIFVNRNAPMNETCMCWGICTGDGWYNLLDQLCSAIQGYTDAVEESRSRNLSFNAAVTAANAGDSTLIEAHYADAYRSADRIAEALEAGVREIRPPVPQVVATQVKEKFGTLNFYYTGGDEYIRGLVSMTEFLSAVTCETCGAPGKLRRGGWLRTLCDTHAK